MRHRALLGPAGSGKTTRVRDFANDGTVFTSTTGVSALNVLDGATTIHALLHFHDRETFEHQRPKFARLLREYNTLVIDEVSMLQAYQLDGIIEGANKAQVNVIVTGDFCQLPPIPERDPANGQAQPIAFAFEADAWRDLHVEHLTTIHRQTDATFLTALASLRAGRAQVDAFRFEPRLDVDFPGTTIFALRKNVDAFNTARLNALPGEERAYAPIRQGEQHPDWRDITPLTIKRGARVMVTRNLRSDGTLTAVNGDTGVVTECEDRRVWVRLDRTDSVIPLRFIEQCWYHPGTQASARQAYDDAIENGQTDSAAYAAQQAILDAGRRGSVTYLPLRVAYALTVHKTQGLTLDRAQVALCEPFMKQPAMIYVALSRVRTLDGLRLVGSPHALRSWCTTHPKVQAYV